MDKYINFQKKSHLKIFNEIKRHDSHKTLTEKAITNDFYVKDFL